MGCAASSVRRTGDKEVDVVSLCREKKHQLKLAVKCRSAFAEAQCKYNHSLLEVASAISLLVERHSSLRSPVLISTSGDSNERVCEDQNCSMTSTRKASQEKEEHEEKQKISKGKEKVVDDDHEEVKGRQYYDGDDDDYDDDEELGCDHFYHEILLHQWDFFDSSLRVGVGESSLSVQEKLIPVLVEEVDQEIVETAEKEFMFASCKNVVASDQTGSEDSQTPTNESPEETHEQDSVAVATKAASNTRELLEALKDVKDQFLRAHEAGLHLSKMLEVSVDLEGLGGNWNKSKPLMTWNQTSSSSSISSSSSTTSSPDWGGMMISGSHQMTLLRLYEWQKKLYKEIKDGDKIFKLYKRKSIQLLNKEAKEGDRRKVDNIRAETKQLYSTFFVSLQSTKTISEKIKQIRDEELHLQLVELLNCLRKTWKVMFESHEIQHQIMHEVGSFSCSLYEKFGNESHVLDSLQLEGALQKWYANFMEYASTQKAYVRAVDGWLRQFFPFEVSFFSKDKSSMPPPSMINRPPLLMLCQNWLALLKLLPDKAVARTLESFCDDVRALWIQQGTEKHQKRKVDKLMRERGRKEKEFSKSIESNFLHQDHEQEPDQENLQKVLEYLKTKKDKLDLFKERVEIERGKHLSGIEQAKQMALIGFHAGFSSVFESLTGFSKASVNMYSDLIVYLKNASDTEEESGNSSGEPTLELN